MTTSLIGVFAASVLIAVISLADAHEGEDHSGTSLAATTTPSPAAPLHVPIETQLLARVVVQGTYQVRMSKPLPIAQSRLPVQ